jgi:hypothetical protein
MCLRRNLFRARLRPATSIAESQPAVPVQPTIEPLAGTLPASIVMNACPFPSFWAHVA